MCILIISSFWAIHYHQMRYWYRGYISYHFLTTMPRKYNQDKIHQQVQIQIKMMIDQYLLNASSTTSLGITNSHFYFLLDKNTADHGI